MIPAQIIARKRDGAELTDGEIRDFVAGYVAGQIPDYQMAALAMAICLRGMSTAETVSLTEQMLHSGEVLRWQNDRPKVDKHSTGGLGDKVSLVLAPLLACCDLQVPMISGRGLGTTGGTLDKLESIPGFRTELTRDEIQRQTEEVGCVICSATADLAPADRQLYGLRDVTATVESVPLITASILSKKLAESLDWLVLDVKFGSGAFMTCQSEARELAESLVHVAHRMGVPTTALLTDMNQPLGRMVGNAVEVEEAVQTLAADGPEDLVTLVLELGAELLVASAAADSPEAARQRLRSLLDEGAALAKFQEMVRAQGGDLNGQRMIAPASTVVAEKTGWLAAVHGQKLGRVIIEMGGGRKIRTDRIDPSVGLEMLVRIGDAVEHGQPLVRVMGPSEDVARVRSMVLDAFEISDFPVESPPLIRQRLGGAAE